MYGIDDKKRYLGLFVEPTSTQFVECIQIVFVGWNTFSVQVRDSLIVNARGELEMITFSGDESSFDWATVHRSDNIFSALSAVAILMIKYEEAVGYGAYSK